MQTFGRIKRESLEKGWLTLITGNCFSKRPAYNRAHNHLPEEVTRQAREYSHVLFYESEETDVIFLYKRKTGIFTGAFAWIQRQIFDRYLSNPSTLLKIIKGEKKPKGYKSGGAIYFPRTT